MGPVLFFLFIYIISTGNASNIVIGVGDYPPGNYNLTVTVQDENGQTVTTVVESFSLSGQYIGSWMRIASIINYPAEPTLDFFNCTLGPEGVTVLCRSSLDDTMVPISYTCSYDDGPEEDCKLNSLPAVHG